jgi:hypothetical protein
MRLHNKSKVIIGIDMVIEYALQNFHEKLVAQACGSLEFEIEGRSQSYRGPFVPISI